MRAPFIIVPFQILTNSTVTLQFTALIEPSPPTNARTDCNSPITIDIPVFRVEQYVSGVFSYFTGWYPAAGAPPGDVLSAATANVFPTSLQSLGATSLDVSRFLPRDSGVFLLSVGTAPDLPAPGGSGSSIIDGGASVVTWLLGSVLASQLSTSAGVTAVHDVSAAGPSQARGSVASHCLALGSGAFLSAPVLVTPAPPSSAISGGVTALAPVEPVPPLPLPAAAAVADVSPPASSSSAAAAAATSDPALNSTSAASAPAPAPPSPAPAAPPAVVRRAAAFSVQGLAPGAGYYFRVLPGVLTLTCTPPQPPHGSQASEATVVVAPAAAAAATASAVGVAAGGVAETPSSWNVCHEVAWASASPSPETPLLYALSDTAEAQRAALVDSLLQAQAAAAARLEDKVGVWRLA